MDCMLEEVRTDLVKYSLSIMKRPPAIIGVLITRVGSSRLSLRSPSLLILI